MLRERLGEKNLYLCHILVQSYPHTCCIQALQWVNRGAYTVWRSRQTFSINVRTWTVLSAPLHVFPSLNDEPTITASAVKKSSMFPTAIPDPSNTGTVACALISVITNNMWRELGNALGHRPQCAPFIEISEDRQGHGKSKARSWVAVMGKDARRHFWLPSTAAIDDYQAAMWGFAQ